MKKTQPLSVLMLTAMHTNSIAASPIPCGSGETEAFYSLGNGSKLFVTLNINYPTGQTKEAEDVECGDNPFTKT